MAPGAIGGTYLVYGVAIEVRVPSFGIRSNWPINYENPSSILLRTAKSTYT